MAAAADKHQGLFVDLFRPSLRRMESSNQPLTINGIHLGSSGDQQIAAQLTRVDAVAAVNAFATGGLAGLIAPHTKHVQHVEPWLTLHGLRIVHERNHSGDNS